jgi:uncharacterized membrane protein
VKLFRLLSHIRSSLWFVPVVCVLAGIVISIGTIAIDRHYDYDLVPESLTGGPDAAVAVFSTVAASMVSLAALVLTVTMVVVQLAMQQFSPRIVQTFLQDKPSQFAIGLFVATFTHAMVALREVRFEADGTVPGVAVLVAYLLVVLCIMVLVAYVHHIGQSLRVASLIELVGNRTRALLDEAYPESGEAGGDRAADDDGRFLLAPKSGVVSNIGHDRLVEVARAAGCSLRLIPALGEFVAAGAPLLEVEGDPTDLDKRRAVSSLVLSLERTLDQDVAYGLRMLVDMAERAVSDSPFLDPTTAVQAIDRLYDCLRQLAGRSFPDGVHRDADGEVRLTVSSMDWDAYVHLAFDEIRMAGAASPQISRRLRASLLDLKTVASLERQVVLDEQLRLLEASTSAALGDSPDVALAMGTDRQGLGVAVGSSSELVSPTDG